MKTSSMLAAGVAIGLLTAGCGAGNDAGGAATGDPGGSAGSGTFTYAVGDEPDTLNPALQDGHTDPVTELIFRGLTRHDPAGDVVPALAASWEISEDELTYTFALREGVTWHDGEPFTAADVVFTIEAIRDGGPDTPLARNFQAVEAITADGEHTVEVTLSEPFAPLLDALSVGMLPAHLLDDTALTDPDFGVAPVGTGPFRLEDYRPGQHARLTAFVDYFDGRPGLDEIVISYVPDDSNRLIRLQAGEVDGAALTPQQVDRIEDDPDLRVEISPTADYRALMFNLAHPDGQDSSPTDGPPGDPPYADPLVRQAMNFAIDREAIIDTVLLGRGFPAAGPMDLSPYADPAVEYDFDPAEVTRLMEAAGYERDGDGLWTDEDGGTVAFDLTTFAEDSLRVAILEVAATQLRDAGFDVTGEPRPRDWVRQHWDRLEAFVVGWGSPFDADTAVYGPFHSSEALEHGGSNLGSWANAEADRALEDARGTNDPEERQEAYSRFQQAVADDPPFVWIAYLEAVNAVPANLTGPTERTLGHHGYGFFADAETWAYTED